MSYQRIISVHSDLVLVLLVVAPKFRLSDKAGSLAVVVWCFTYTDTSLWVVTPRVLLLRYSRGRIWTIRYDGAHRTGVYIWRAGSALPGAFGAATRIPRHAE